MSGTSLDGIDACLVSINDNHLHLIDSLEQPLPDLLRQELLALCQPGNNEIERMGRADRQLAQLYADYCLQLLDKNQLKAENITAIGSHGQTIRHQPEGKSGFSLQIGDPNTLAQLTNITTVADFRRRDIAAGGQGAPLAPVFHSATFGSSKHNRAIVNIGGMANISFINSDGTTQGYDTGPGNVLLDAWISKHLGLSYDKSGKWASSGTINTELLKQLLSHPYFTAPAPKSTGRELFNLAWLEQQLGQKDIPAENVQATLLELTAQSICQEIERNNTNYSEVYLCGGGAYNTRLAQRIETLLHPSIVASTSALGISPEWVEASCFAWLAKQTLLQCPINTPPITGANKSQILGGIYYA